MLTNYIIPAFDLSHLHICDVGEETSAFYTSSKPVMQRFRYIIHFVVNGEGVFRRTTLAVTTEHHLQANTAFAIFENDAVYYNSLPENPMHYFWIGFVGEESKHIMKYIGFSPEIPTIIFTHPEKIIAAFRKLFASWKEHDYYEFTANFFSLISIMRKYNQQKTELNLLKSNNDLLELAVQYIRANLHNNIRVQDIAAELNIDRCHFSRIFKKNFSISPHEYINNLRLREAENLLLMGNYNVSQIVEILNFPDIYSFTKRFKKFFHCSPLQYRKKISAMEKTTNSSKRKKTQ